VDCPACGGDTKQVFHAVGVHFKGSGFHNTDYRPKPASSDCDSCPASSGASGG
jgi:predicted nucleic acid-binding Zn ribbon protein